MQDWCMALHHRGFRAVLNVYCMLTYTYILKYLKIPKQNGKREFSGSLTDQLTQSMNPSYFHHTPIFEKLPSKIKICCSGTKTLM